MSGITDSLFFIRAKYKNLEKYTQIFLVQHFCKESYSAHDAVEDVKMLSNSLLASVVYEADLCQAAYDAETHFLQDTFNSAKALYLPSLNVLIGNGVLKMSMAEKFAGSGLDLHHLKIV